MQSVLCCQVQSGTIYYKVKIIIEISFMKQGSQIYYRDNFDLIMYEMYINVLLKRILNKNYCTIFLVTYLAAVRTKEVFTVIFFRKPGLAVTVIHNI